MYIHACMHACMHNTLNPQNSLNSSWYYARIHTHAHTYTRTHTQALLPASAYRQLKNGQQVCRLQLGCLQAQKKKEYEKLALWRLSMINIIGH